MGFYLDNIYLINKGCKIYHHYFSHALKQYFLITGDIFNLHYSVHNYRLEENSCTAQEEKGGDSYASIFCLNDKPYWIPVEKSLKMVVTYHSHKPG